MKVSDLHVGNTSTVGLTCKRSFPINFTATANEKVYIKLKDVAAGNVFSGDINIEVIGDISNPGFIKKKFNGVWKADGNVVSINETIEYAVGDVLPHISISSIIRVGSEWVIKLTHSDAIAIGCTVVISTTSGDGSNQSCKYFEIGEIITSDTVVYPAIEEKIGGGLSSEQSTAIADNTTKLGTIESGATADQSDAEIVAGVSAGLGHEDWKTSESYTLTKAKIEAELTGVVGSHSHSTVSGAYISDIPSTTSGDFVWTDDILVVTHSKNSVDFICKVVDKVSYVEYIVDNHSVSSNSIELDFTGLKTKMGSNGKLTIQFV